MLQLVLSLTENSLGGEEGFGKREHREGKGLIFASIKVSSAFIPTESSGSRFLYVKGVFNSTPNDLVEVRIIR